MTKEFEVDDAVEYGQAVLPSLKLQLAISGAPLVLSVSKIETFGACDAAYIKSYGKARFHDFDGIGSLHRTIDSHRDRHSG